jgi:phospholipid-binding lipoprotein MlaA
VAGCATGPDPRDPFEPFNRGVYRFNDELDTAILKPAASTYREVLPGPVRTGVHNFFGNLADAWSAVNSLLQLKVVDGTESLFRFGVNTFFGLGGLMDVASEMGIERHREDFGQTLGRWGVPSGPYVVLPLFGPSTVRDTAALPVDRQGDPLRQFDPTATRNQLYGVRVLDTRANLLGASRVLEEVALDRYTFVRDAYLQRRRAEVFEGEPPELPPNDEPKE